MRVSKIILSVLSFAAFLMISGCKDDPVSSNSNHSNGTSSLNMVLVGGGTFSMGSTDGHDDQKPVHKVTLSSYYISRYEITQAQYKAAMGSNPSYFSGNSLPVEQLRWYDAVEFCNKLSEKDGFEPCYTINKTLKDANNISYNDSLKWTVTCDWGADGYRLPTEAEWEFAARGGIKSRGYTYSRGNTLDDVAWHDGNSTNDAGLKTTHAVGGKKANELGIYDMTGNVQEWCWDWYSVYDSAAQINPTGGLRSSSRINRDLSWASMVGNYSCSNRGITEPYYAYSWNGVRPVRRAN